MEKSIVLGGTWDEPRAVRYPWHGMRGMAALPDASRPTLPDLQHREAPAGLCLGMATGFTAGKQPGAPQARSREGPSRAPWGPSHISKVIPSIFPQLGGLRGGGGCRGAGPGLPVGTTAAAARAGTAAQALRHRCRLVARCRGSFAAALENVDMFFETISAPISAPD